MFDFIIFEMSMNELTDKSYRFTYPTYCHFYKNDCVCSSYGHLIINIHLAYQEAQQCFWPAPSPQKLNFFNSTLWQRNFLTIQPRQFNSRHLTCRYYIGGRVTPSLKTLKKITYNLRNLSSQTHAIATTCRNECGSFQP